MLSNEGALKYRKLRQAYRESLEPKRAGLEECWQAVQTNAWSLESLNTLKLYAHRLAGSAAPYGFDTISEASSDLERLILDYLEGVAPKTQLDQTKKRIATAFQELSEALNKGQSTPD